MTNNDAAAKIKTFDCVEMKNNIQAELLKERKGKAITQAQQILEAFKADPQLLEIYNRSKNTKDQNKS